MWLLVVLMNIIIFGLPIDCFAFFDVKIQPGTIWIGGVVAVGAATGIVKIILNIIKCVKNHIGRIESFKIFQSKGMCEEKSGSIEKEIKTMGDSIHTRLDDIKDLILKNGK